MMPPSKENAYKELIELMTVCQKLTLKAIEAPKLQNLIFIILNDTTHVLAYDQAVLWQIAPESSPKILGVSGQTTFSTTSEKINSWKESIRALPDKGALSTFSEGKESHIFWVPISQENGHILALWLEKWGEAADPFPEDKRKLLENYLLPGYKAAWKRLGPSLLSSKLRAHFNVQRLSWMIAAVILGLSFIRLPLRIVAPCEVAPLDPWVVTAPLEGIIKSIHIKPGQEVAENDPLYYYDEEAPLQDLKVAQKQVEIIQSELARIVAGGVKDDRALEEMAELDIRLKKARVDLDYAEYRASLLVGKASTPGVAILENPDNWRGKPVKIGERIMVIANPKSSKVKIWIPEGDNVYFDLSHPVKIILNSYPEQTLEAKISYISDETLITDLGISSFLAEAHWIELNKRVQLGEKGSAILYGENVSLMYYILRKPIRSVRTFFGV